MPPLPPCNRRKQLRTGRGLVGFDGGLFPWLVRGFRLGLPVANWLGRRWRRFVGWIVEEEAAARITSDDLGVAADLVVLLRAQHDIATRTFLAYRFCQGRLAYRQDAVVVFQNLRCNPTTQLLPFGLPLRQCLFVLFGAGTGFYFFFFNEATLHLDLGFTLLARLF